MTTYDAWDEGFAEPAKLAEVTGDDPVGDGLDLPDALPVMFQGIGDGEPVLDGGLHLGKHLGR